MAGSEKVVKEEIKAEDELSRLKKELEEVKGMLLGSKGGKIIQESAEKLKRTDRIAGGGWLIKTPIETYAGITEGVMFADGMALVDEDMEGADMKVHRLEHDHGYQAAAVSGEEIGKLRKLIAMKQNGGAGGRTLLEKMTLPAGGR